MGIEIERKFLVKGEAWRSLSTPIRYRQGYITSGSGRTVRVRIAGDRGFLTIKGQTQGLSRLEFEYEIPIVDAEVLLDTLCDRPLIEKHRSRIAIGSWTWEVDEFFGDNQGLILAEVELQSESEAIELPDWIGEEVSHDSRYYNSNLSKHPFTRWS